MLIDSHCHLNMKDLANDLDIIINEAYNNNIKGMLTISTKIDEADDVKKISNKYNNIWYSLGVHPNNVDDKYKDLGHLIQNNIKNKKFIGIGETGLDYFYENSKKNLQKKSFKYHIKLARDYDIPIIVHTRNADTDTINILKEEYYKGKFRGLIHCFTASKELADVALEIGFYISVSGIITFKNAENIRKTVSNIPVNRLLVETDAPYLAPIPMRGKINQPSYVSYTADYLAKLLNINSFELYEKTTSNFFNLFNRAEFN